MRTSSGKFGSDGTSSAFGIENLCDNTFDPNLYASLSGLIPTNGAGWTTGGTTITPVTLPPPGSTDNIKVFSYTVNASLILKNSNHSCSFGKLGLIRAGLTQLSPTPSTFSNPLLPYPVDMSLITTIYDPASENLPPLATGGANFTLMKVSTTNILPTPLLLPGMIYNIGIWQETSLLGGFNNAPEANPGLQMTICNATWALAYALDGDPDF